MEGSFSSFKHANRESQANERGCSCKARDRAADNGDGWGDKGHRTKLLLKEEDGVIVNEVLPREA
jgi:hypothetical protein